MTTDTCQFITFGCFYKKTLSSFYGSLTSRHKELTIRYKYNVTGG